MDLHRFTGPVMPHGRPLISNRRVLCSLFYRFVWISAVMKEHLTRALDTSGKLKNQNNLHLTPLTANRTEPSINYSACAAVAQIKPHSLHICAKITECVYPVFESILHVIIVHIVNYSLLICSTSFAL